jgi:hypothetical protein
MRFRSMHWFVWIGAGACLAVACAEGAELSSPVGSGGGSEPGTGGAAGNGNGGNANTGGSSNNTGGSGANTGGASGSSGSGGSGGTGGRGGSAGTGGSSGSSGTGGSAGASGSGGSAGTGGLGGTGGSIGSGGSAGGTACGSAVPFDAGAGQVLFFDSFEADAGARAWIPISTSTNVNELGTWGYVTADGGSRVFAQSQSNTASAVLMAVNGNTAWTDQVIEANVIITHWDAMTTSTFVGICGRYASPQNYYCAQLRGDGRFVLRSRINNSGTTLNSSAPTVATAGFTGAFKLKLEIRGNTLNGYYNGAALPTATVTDTTICSGGVALFIEGAQAQFDDFKVTMP